MALVTRRKKVPAVSEVEETVEIKDPTELLELLRERIRERVHDGMQSHEAQDAQMSLLAIVDELDLKLNPPKKG